MNSEQKIDPKLIQDLLAKYWVNVKGLKSIDMIRTTDAGLFVDFIMEQFCIGKLPQMMEDKLKELATDLPKGLDPYRAIAFTTGFSLGIFLSELGLANVITAERTKGR